MTVDPPMWELRAPSCPCCRQGHLAFEACPACGHVVLVCNEVGTVFPDPRNLPRTMPMAGEVDRNATCPSCHGPALRTFRNATSDEIKALGFNANQFQ